MESDCEPDSIPKAAVNIAVQRSKHLRKLESAWQLGTNPARTAFANDEKHHGKCEKGRRCMRCSYVTRGPELAKHTRMFDPEVLAKTIVSADKLMAAKGCWLASAVVDGTWGLGCIVCCANGLPGTFGSFTWMGSGSNGSLKLQKLVKHSQSNEHERALASYFGLVDASIAAPTREEMLEQLQTLQEGKAGKPHRKARAMTWCLSEALLDIDRAFVRKAVTLVICRDDRAQRLLMRFTGATTDLEVRSGVLGIGTAHRERPDADGIVAATKEVLDNFCTPRRGAPSHGSGPHNVESASVDAKLLNHTRAIIEVIAVDEESAELKAADIGRGRRASALELQPITPNLKFATRDKAHGFRRVLKRPFAADAYLNDLLDETIVRKHSVVQRIWNSPILRTRLNRRIKEAADSNVGSAANLKAAKHRFESFAAPLGRMLLHLEEFLDEVQETCDDRGQSAEAIDCWEWLGGLDDEKLYQLAMLADCSDEILVATRMVDTEDVDTSTMHDSARALLERLDALFNKKKCLTIPGYTKHVLDILKRPRLFYGPNGAIKSVGGRAADAALQNCFRRMEAYTALVADVVRTEFPDYELLCAFSVFNLDDSGRDRPANTGGDISLQRLAKAFDVHEAALKDQYHRLRAVALQKKRDRPDVCNKTAWQEAVRSCHRHHGTKLNWNLSALLPVLWRFVGWTAATSGVEQNFSKALRSIGPQRGSLTPEHEETAVRFAVYKPEQKELDTLIAKARELWAAHYGSPREMSVQRCDKGTHKVPASAVENTETAWLGRRRAAAIDAGQQIGDSTALSVEAAEAGCGWTDGHVKEHIFQSKKRAKKELQALQDGILLQHEIRPDMEDALRDMQDRNMKADKETKRKHVNKQLRRGASKLIIKVGTVACINVSTGRDQIERVLISSRTLLEEELSMNVQLLVVDDPARLTKLQSWLVALKGALVCSPEAVLTSNDLKGTGPFLQYKAAIKGQRNLHLSPRFQIKHGETSTLLQDACQLPNSHWKLREATAPRCTVLGGPEGMKASRFLRSISHVIRSECRAS